MKGIRWQTTIWALHDSGNYSVKRGYHKAWNDYIASRPDRPSSSTVPGPSFWNFLWNLNIPPKLKHFLVAGMSQ